VNDASFAAARNWGMACRSAATVAPGAACPCNPSQVTAAVRQELDARGAYASVAVFWGRERYVTLLWQYLERNLRVNGGIVRSFAVPNLPPRKPWYIRYPMPAWQLASPPVHVFVCAARVHPQVDEVLLITNQRDTEEGAAGAKAILDNFVAKYAGPVHAQSEEHPTPAPCIPKPRGVPPLADTLAQSRRCHSARCPTAVRTTRLW
jgi:hypothetical protein